MPDFSLERCILKDNSECCVVGLDEVGMGALAGPIVAAAIMLQSDPFALPSSWMSALDDSKKLSAKKREELSSLILGQAVAVGIGWASSLDAIYR